MYGDYEIGIQPGSGTDKPLAIPAERDLSYACPGGKVSASGTRSVRDTPLLFAARSRRAILFIARPVINSAFRTARACRPRPARLLRVSPSYKNRDDRRQCYRRGNFCLRYGRFYGIIKTIREEGGITLNFTRNFRRRNGIRVLRPLRKLRSCFSRGGRLAGGSRRENVQRCRTLEPCRISLTVFGLRLALFPRMIAIFRARKSDVYLTIRSRAIVQR